MNDSCVKPVRIGQFHALLPEPGRKPCGVDIVVHQLANALAADPSRDVTVYSLSPRPVDATYKYVRLTCADWRIWRIKAARLLLLPLMLNHYTFDHDVLHLHGDDWFFFRRRLPTVRTLHGSALYEARTATSWKRRLSQRFVYRLERLAVRLATLSLAVGSDTVALYAADRQIDNGVDLEHYHPGPKADRPRVLFVGTWHGRKRGEFLYRRFIETIRPSVPDAELVMVCDTEPPAAAGVRYVHLPSQEELADLYRSAWIFAYPSVYEGFGITYLEAMASGTCVISSPNPGASHVLDGGRLGRLVDDEGFARAVTGLLTDATTRERYEQDGLAAVRKFDWQHVAATHHEAYADAISRWNERR